MNLAAKIFYAADKHLKDTTLKMLPHDTGATLLDLGCGDCQFTRRLVNRTGARKVIAVDAIDARVGYAQSNNWQSIKADLNQALPILSDSVDIIHAGDVIEHLNNTDTFVKEIKRILKPGGYAVISTPNLASWHNIFALMDGKHPMTCHVSDEIPMSVIEADKDMPKHRRIFTHEGLVKLLKYHGLKIEQVKGAGYYPVFNFIAGLDWQHAAYVIVKVSKCS